MYDLMFLIFAVPIILIVMFIQHKAERYRNKKFIEELDRKYPFD